MVEPCVGSICFFLIYIVALEACVKTEKSHPRQKV